MSSMLQQKAGKQNAPASPGSENQMSPGRTMAPPDFGFAESKSGEVAQRQSAGTMLAQAQTTPVIETTSEGWSHYQNGGGTPVDIGPNSINTLMGMEDFLFRHNRITGGLTTALSGNFSVDMTGTIFHLGRTNIDYDVQVNGNQCTVTYTLFVGDGFWDVDEIDEKILGGIGLPWFQPDGPGPNLERFGGTPYAYNTATRSFTFANPGYQ